MTVTRRGEFSRIKMFNMNIKQKKHTPSTINSLYGVKSHISHIFKF